MTLAKLPNGRWRARIWHEGKDQSVAKILGLPNGTSWRTKTEAREAYNKAREILRQRSTDEVTVGEFWARWTTDPVFARPKDSTNIHNRERTKAFADRYENVLLRQVGRKVTNGWLAGGMRNGTIPALRAMFNDAIRFEYADRNPFANLGVSRGRGNRDVKPPSQDVVRSLIQAARSVAGPGFAGWLQVAAYTGMRPGELDALRWDAVDFDRSRILVAEQFDGRRFTLPKNGLRRWAPLTPPARAALLEADRSHEFCFVNLRGSHWSASARAYHWKATRAAAGYDGTLYLATRHHAGSYMTNVLGLTAEDVAIALGHTDGGYLVRTLYGHRDEELALDRVVRAYEDRENVVEMPKREERNAS